MANKTVLLILDDQALQQQLDAHLSNAGFVVRRADLMALNSTSAESAPAVIILDAAYPGDAGRVIRTLRVAGQLACPIIILSVRDDLEARLDAVRAGCDGYLLKPVAIPELVDEVQRLSRCVEVEPYRVLIVDDDTMPAAHYASLLSAAGFTAEVLNDPRKLMEMLAKFRPDLILMELDMSTFSGCELATIIRQQRDFRHLPILFLTTCSDRCSDPYTSTDDYLSKPVAPELLVSSIRARAQQSRLLSATIASLFASEQRFKDFAVSGSDRLWEMDANFRFIFAADSTSQALSPNPNHILGKTRWELAGDDPRQRETLRAHQSILEAHQPFRDFRYTIVDQQGRPHYWRVSGKPVFNRQGVFVGYRGTSTEETAAVEARQRAQIAETRLREAVASIPGGFALYDAQDRLVLCNKRYILSPGHAEIFQPGISFEDILRTELAVGLVADAAGREQQWLTDRLKHHRNPEGIIEQRLQDGRWLQINERKMDDGGTVAIVIDISRRKQYQQELEIYRNHLEALVAERTTELQHIQEELLKRERLATLGQLTATVSHELRNPLAAMRPSVYVIRKRMDQKDIRLQQAVTRLERGITRCDHIIDELLDYTHIQTLKLRSIVVDEWLTTLLDEHPVPAGMSLRRELGLAGVCVSLDPDRLRRAVMNVYENACQAMCSEDGSVITSGPACLTVTTRVTDEHLQIVIADTGPGIAAEVLPKIFEPLYSTKNFGVGLGLPTVKQILQQHRGGIEIDTEPGRGTRVVLWLPLA